MMVSQEFAAEFEARADEIYERANDLDDRFQYLAVDQLRGELWKFSHVDLAEFRSFLRHCSLTLRQMLGDRNKPPAGSGKAGSKPEGKKGPGRPSNTDFKRDKQLWEAMKSGRYTYEELARDRGLTKKEVELAVDRHRKRESKRQGKR
jgi:hypothetical protein